MIRGDRGGRSKQRLSPYQRRISKVMRSLNVIPILIDNCGCGMDGVTVGRGLKSPLAGLSAHGPACAGPFFAVTIDRRGTINLPIWYQHRDQAYLVHPILCAPASAHNRPFSES